MTVKDVSSAIHPYPTYTFGVYQLTAAETMTRFLGGTIGRMFTKKNNNHKNNTPTRNTNTSTVKITPAATALESFQ